MINRLYFLIISLLFFTSCSLHEEIDLSQKDKGYYQLHTDMGAMVGMMSAMSSTSAIPDSIAKQMRDTSFSLASMIDSAGGDFTAAEKAYFYNATMQVKLDIPASKMDVYMKFPVKDAMDLKKLFALWSKVDSLSELKKNQKQVAASDDAPKVPQITIAEPASEIPSPNDLPFKPSPYIITENSIQRIALTKDDILKDLGETGQGLLMAASQVNYTATIKLSRPVKRLTGKKVTMSPDKRTVVYAASLQDLIDDPTAGEFLIIY